MKLSKKILCALLALVLLVSLLPTVALAGAEDCVYVSISNDGQFICDKNNAAVAYRAVALSDLRAISLEDYQLGEFAFDGDNDGSFDVTALHLYIYVQEQIMGLKWSDVNVSGSPGGIFFEEGLFGFEDCNLNYYHNGVYPELYAGWGATADNLCLKPGDYLDIAGYTSWDFYSDSAAGFHYFLDEDYEVTHTYTLDEGQTLDFALERHGGGFGLAQETFEATYCTVYYGTTLGEAVGSVTTDFFGEATIPALSAGKWYLWCDGGYGEENPNVVVSAPGVAILTVNASVKEPIYDGTLQFSHSLTLENDISINFIGKGEQLSQYESFCLECTLPVYEGNEKVGSRVVTVEPVFNGTNYEFTLSGVTAKMMNDEIEAVFRLTKAGQEYYSRTDVYSVAEYAYGKLNSTKAADTDELKAICANLLRYGALAQTQFNYRTDALVDANMTDAHKAYLTDLNTVEMKDCRKQLNDLNTVIVPWKSTTLELGNKVIMCLIVNLENYTGDPAELRMRLSYVDSNGLTVNEERALELYNPETQTYAVSYDGLRATEMRTIVSAALYLGETRVSRTVEYSIESYAARNPSELCRAMLAYSDSAAAFFAK